MNKNYLKLGNLEIQSMFTVKNKFFFSRWSGNIVPMILGVNDFSLGLFKKKLISILSCLPIQIDEFEIEKKANYVFIFFKKWDELYNLPNIEEIIPDHLSLLKSLSFKNPSQYRRFYFDKNGGINFCVFLIPIEKEIDESSYEELIIQILIKSILIWSEEFQNFKNFYFFNSKKGEFCLSNDFLSFLKACYDPVLPDKTNDASHSLRIFARYKLNMENLHEI